ncbi:MAG: LysM peptidoglycan-binding domain-containing protein [Steroidobacteraceae bacterium]|jgi:nucleoid-associated protein YgaU
MDTKDQSTTGAANPYAQIHEVQKGDTLGKIAQKYYGDPALYTQIFAANKNQLKDPNKIFPGQKLVIP